MAAAKQRKTAGTKQRAGHPGVEIRHVKACPARHGAGRCACSPTYRAKVYSKREGRWMKRSFDTLGEAKDWRRDTEVALRRGTVRATATPTLAEMAEQWLAGARAGAIRNRSGDAYTAGTSRSTARCARGTTAWCSGTPQRRRSGRAR